MESDISLIEVAGEDDSLLQQIPEDDLLILDKDKGAITAGNSGFFLCSPLLTGRSNGAIAGSSTPSTDYTDKENINANSIEGPKLSIIRQQMKRKKAGGFNLRKSLAWNKAFFTEEGVLDSMELSMITGSTSTSCGEALGTIDEEIPAISTPCGDRKNGCCLLPKHGSSTKDNVKLKELSAKDVNRSASKRGSCPRPVASSSAKRPTASNAAKTVNKEERISRIPVPKRDPTVISRTLRSAATIRASDAKSNQVAQRVGNNPRMSTLKGSSINAKTAVNKDVNASKSLKAKTSIQQPRRKLANPVLKTNEGSKAATNSLISKPLPSNDDGTRKVSASITHNAPPDGRSVLNQTQMPKPSGLRMPSPSMGFFGQKKVSSFQSLPPATSEFHDLPKSNIPNVRIAGPSNPICQLATLVPRKFLKGSNGEALGSSVEPVSRDRNKSILKVANIHLGKVNVVGASTMNKVLSAHGLEEPDVLSLSNPVLEHLGDVPRIHDEINDQLPECKPHHVSFNNFGETNDLGIQGTPRAFDDRLNGAQDCNEQSSEQVELTNSSNCMIGRTSSPDHQRLEIGTCNSLKRSRSSIEFEHGRFEENVGNDSNGQLRCSFDQDEALETHKMRKAEASDIDHCISNECNNTMQSASALSNSDSMHIDDEKPTVLMSNCKSLQGNGCSLTSQHDYTSCENEVLARVSNEVCESKLESEIGLSLIPHSTADACLDSPSVDRNCNHRTDEMVDIRSDMQQNNTSLEMERNQDDHGDVAIACNADADETLLITQNLCASDTENQLHEAHIRIGSEQLQNDDKQNSPVLSSVNDFNQLPGFAELQNCCIDLIDVSPNNQEKCSMYDLLHTEKSEEHSEEIITDSVIDNSNVCTSEFLGNYNRIASPEDNSTVHAETHDTRTGYNILESQEIETSLRSSKCSTAKTSEYDKILSGEGASETMSEEISSEARTSCDNSSFCSLAKDLGSSVSNDHILSRENVEQHMEAKEWENHPSLEMNGNISCQNENELNSETNRLVDIETCWTYDDNAQSDARTSCNDSSFCLLTKGLGSSVPNDHILSRENVQQSMETNELENHKSPEMNGNILCQNENELNSEMDHPLETCSTYDNNAQSEARTSCNDLSFCSPTKDLSSSVPSDHILSPEMNGNILCQSDKELNSEMDPLLDTEMCSTYDENAQSMQLRKYEDDAGKQNGLGIKTSTNAVPFSEEWLAAFEAAGEEILTMKTGAVQNSPPDKSQPEPGPWSPVKRKNNQEIGPFDCTKCTNGSQVHESC